MSLVKPGLTRLTNLFTRLLLPGFKAKRRVENIQEWKEKPLYGQFERQGKNQRSEEMWIRLKEGKLKRETEALIVAAQDQAIRANYVLNNDWQVPG